MKIKKKCFMFLVFGVVLFQLSAFATDGLGIDSSTGSNKKYFRYNGRYILLISGALRDVPDATTVHELKECGINQFRTLVLPRDVDNGPYNNDGNVGNNWGGWNDDDPGNFWDTLKSKARILQVNEPDANGNVIPHDDDGMLFVVVFSTCARKCITNVYNKYCWKDGSWKCGCSEQSGYSNTMWASHLWNEDNGGPIPNWIEIIDDSNPCTDAIRNLPDNVDENYGNVGVRRFYNLYNSYGNFLFDYTNEDNIESQYWGGQNPVGGKNGWKWKSQYRQEQLLAKLMKELDPSKYPNVAIVLEWETSRKDWCGHMVTFLKEVRMHMYPDSVGPPIGVGNSNPVFINDVMALIPTNNGYVDDNIIFAFREGSPNIVVDGYNHTNREYPIVYEGYHPTDECGVGVMEHPIPGTTIEKRCVCYCTDALSGYVVKDMEIDNIMNVAHVIRKSILVGMNTTLPFQGYWYNNGDIDIKNATCNGGCDWQNYRPEDNDQDHAGVKDQLTEFTTWLRKHVLDTVEDWEDEPQDEIAEKLADDILVFSPTSDDKFDGGDHITIKWVTVASSENDQDDDRDYVRSNHTGDVDITLVNETTGASTDIGTFVYDDFPVDYEIPTDMETGYYYVNIVTSNYGNYCGRSGTFTIGSYINITDPNGGEELGLGAPFDITWDSLGLSVNVKISLWKDDVKLGLIADDVNPASGSSEWTVGQYIGGQAVEGTGYKIKIKAKGIPVFDFSDESFSIASITVTSPNGGENWQIGTSQNITWDAQEVTLPVKITLWKDGLQVGLIDDDLNPASGSFSWTVGSHSGGTAPAGTGYTIKIKAIGAWISDTSDAAFTLEPEE